MNLPGNPIKVQQLQNHNLLISQPGRARAFEVDREGNKVWEWVAEPYDQKLTPEIMEASRYPYSIEQVIAWSGID